MWLGYGDHDGGIARNALGCFVTPLATHCTRDLQSTSVSEQRESRTHISLVQNVAETTSGSPSPAEGSFPWCKWKTAKNCSQRASEMHSCHVAQGSCKRSGCVPRERVKLQADLVPMLQKRPLGAPRQPKAAFLGANGRLKRTALKSFGNAFVS